MFGLVLFFTFRCHGRRGVSVTNIINDGCISLGSASFRADIVHRLPLCCGNRGIVELLITPVLFLPDESNLLLLKYSIAEKFEFAQDYKDSHLLTSKQIRRSFLWLLSYRNLLDLGF